MLAMGSDHEADHADQQPGVDPGKRPEGKARTGKGISGDHTGAWDHSKSRAACELTRMMRDTMMALGKADRVKCELAAQEAAGKFTMSSDGTTQYAKKSLGEHPRLLRIAATKDATTGVLTGFTLDSCVQDHDTGNYSQDSHIAISVDATTLSSTVIAAGSHSRENKSIYGRAMVTGTLNTDGTWSSSGKTLTFEGARGDGEHSQSQSLSISQDASTLILSGFRTAGDTEHSMINQVYAEAQILDSATVDTIAIGDGSAKVLFTRNGMAGPELVTSWSGDTMAVLNPASDGTYYADVDAATLPAVGTVSSSAYATGEDWDCTVPSDATAVELSDADLGADALAACGKRDISDHDGDIECDSGS